MNNNNFLIWLVGFLDAEANYQTTMFKRLNKAGKVISFGVKYAFHLSLHQRDKELLETIQQFFNGIGKIYEYDHRNEARLAITTIADLNHFIKVHSNYSLLTVHQATRYEQFRLGIVNKLTTFKTLEEYQAIKVSPIIPTLIGIDPYFLDNWIAGFLNGEVSFSFKTLKNKELIPFFMLEHTDERVVNMIKDRLELSTNIGVRIRLNKTTGLPNKTIFVAQASSAKDIKNIVKFLDAVNNLKGYKLLQYNNWKKRFYL